MTRYKVVFHFGEHMKGQAIFKTFDDATTFIEEQIHDENCTYCEIHYFEEGIC